MTTPTHAGTDQLWDDNRIIETIHDLGLRDNSPRINIDDAIDRMIAVRDDYEAALDSLRQQLDERDERYKKLLELNQRNCDDALRIKNTSDAVFALLIAVIGREEKKA